MKSNRWRMAVVVAGAIGAYVPPAGGEELTVRIIAAAPAARSEAEAKATLDQLDALRKEQKDLAEALKRQFGKKEELWPADKKKELDGLYLKISHQAFAHRYAAPGGATAKEMEEEARAVEASAAGIRQKLDPKKGVRAVTVAEEADLQVEVLGRGTMRDVLDQRVAVIGFRVVAGGRLDPAQLAAKPVVWPFHGSLMSGSTTTPVHAYTAEEPYWWIESERPLGRFPPQAMYGKMESQLNDSMAKLLKEQGAAVAACRKAR